MNTADSPRPSARCGTARRRPRLTKLREQFPGWRFGSVWTSAAGDSPLPVGQYLATAPI